MIIYVFFRITAFFIATNVIFPSGTPKMFKVILSLLLSVMIGFNISVSVQVENLYDLLTYAVFETINGLVLGYIVNVCFYSLKIGGKLIDNQLGLSMASTYDPNTESQVTIMENLMYFIGLAVFFITNTHHILITSIQHSFNLIPVGYSILDNNLEYVVKVFCEYFIIGIKIGIPMIVVLIVTDLITGIISRSISGLNVMIIGMPLKILIGLIFFMSALPFILNHIHDIFKSLKGVLEGTFVFNQQMNILLSTLL